MTVAQRQVSDLNDLIYPRGHDALGVREMVFRKRAIGPYAPPEPPIPPTAVIGCIGSCFAQEITRHLAAQGRAVAPVWLSERWNTTFALRHFVESALDGTPFPDGFLGEVKPDTGEFTTGLAAAEAFILTFGLSVCWYENATGRMVLDVAGGHGNAGIIRGLRTHAMRQTTVAENVAQIQATLACIRRHKPNAPIVMTLSPIPLLLAATLTPVLPTNAISKATLHVALHEVWAAAMENVYYWPSYEMVDWTSLHHGPVWGQDGEDLRHLSSGTVGEIMTLFSNYYIAP